MISVLYILMAIGITFIYSIMKMINWAMGEFYMIGGYLQYLLVTAIFGVQYWFIALPIAMFSTFIIGVGFQRILLKPMFLGGIERRDDYATIVTIALMVLLRNLAVVIGGPYIYSTPDYFPPVHLGPLPVNGSRFVAFISAFIILIIFYIIVKKTWIGLAFQATAQNRIGVEAIGINPLKIDQLTFGIGVALAAAAGALLAPVFLVYPESGSISTMKGFEIIVIGGLGSIPGAVVGGFLLGMVETLGSVFINPSFRDIYGFLLLMLILAIKPVGLFGEKVRVA
ncbi:MAG: branched-chain amino acid ABC transporter permease [Nitrososphaerales archaeon]